MQEAQTEFTEILAIRKSQNPPCIKCKKRNCCGCENFLYKGKKTIDNGSENGYTRLANWLNKHN